MSVSFLLILRWFSIILGKSEKSRISWTISKICRMSSTTGRSYKGWRSTSSAGILFLFFPMWKLFDKFLFGLTEWFVCFSANRSCTRFGRCIVMFHVVSENTKRPVEVEFCTTRTAHLQGKKKLGTDWNISPDEIGRKSQCFLFFLWNNEKCKSHYNLQKIWPYQSREAELCPPLWWFELLFVTPTISAKSGSKLCCLI